MGADQKLESGSLTRHRASFWSMYWFCLGWAALLAFLILVIAERSVPDPFGFTLGIGVAAGAEALLLAAVVAYFPTTVGADGIGGFDAFGRRRFLRWHDIGAVRPINVVGLKWLRAFPADGNGPIWLPLFLENRRAFEERVFASAPDRNVLRDFLAARAGRLGGLLG